VLALALMTSMLCIAACLTSAALALRHERPWAAAPAPPITEDHSGRNRVHEGFKEALIYSPAALRVSAGTGARRVAKLRL